MGEYFLRKRKEIVSFLRLRNLRSRFKGVRITKRKILLSFILVLCMRLFFSMLFEEKASAQYQEAVQKPDMEIVDPMIRIEKAMAIPEEKKELPKLCEEQEIKRQEEKDKIEDALSETNISELVNGHPMEKMAPAIAKEKKIVAAFLIGIAKKESDWGTHSPKKNGKDCFNYWGYKGSYNPTASGYSCFDSPEQAVKEVGGRINNLVDKKINTPEKMLVWKCGSSCAGHDPQGVRKWVADVSLYFYKLNS